jgi:sialic acid synthase SpsE/mannose-6-phosphate isomerase-like protein (cupin superfamily)
MNSTKKESVVYRFNSKPLFIFEIANNHMGDLSHGIRIIKEFGDIAENFKSEFDFAVKLQYRDLDTFIHDDYKNDEKIKYVKRFKETRLDRNSLKKLSEAIKEHGFISMCTPFDENSVDLIEEHNFDFLKVASCSLTDWPLLERIAKVNKPIVFSTAGASLDEIDKVVSFFLHREKNICVMHCVGEYPTSKESLQLNQIDLIKKRYIDVPVGYSTHEDPDNFESVKLAVAKGARLFERHIGLKTEKYGLNAYSSTPEQINNWLLAAKEAFIMCGEERGRHKPSEKEITDLKGLRRGVFAKVNIKKGEKLEIKNCYFAIPNFEGQILANDLSKYMEYTALEDIKKDKPVFFKTVKSINKREKVLEIVNKIKDLLIKSKVYLPNKLDFELSHHYGIENYSKYGAAIVSVINREYCKKLIILFPGQENPSHHHVKKEETFHILYGSLIINIDGKEKEYNEGEMIVIERGVKHSFSSKSGCVFEEISTTHYKDDSFYGDEKIMNNKDRKTQLTFWSDWLLKDIN